MTRVPSSGVLGDVTEYGESAAVTDREPVYSEFAAQLNRNGDNPRLRSALFSTFLACRETAAEAHSESNVKIRRDEVASEKDGDGRREREREKEHLLP